MDKYNYSKQITGIFSDVETKLRAALPGVGFGVVSEIDLSGKFNEKLGIEFPRYKILGACNPAFAHKAVLAEPQIGVLLPCNFIIREAGKDTIEIAAVNPLMSMQSVGNAELAGLATEVQQKLKKIIDEI